LFNFQYKPKTMRSISAFTFLLLTGNLFSQYCSNYYFLQNNKTVEMTITNGKGEEAGKMTNVESNSKMMVSSITATINLDCMYVKKYKQKIKLYQRSLVLVFQ